MGGVGRLAIVCAVCVAAGSASAGDVSIRAATSGAWVQAASDRVVVRPDPALSVDDRRGLYADHRCALLRHLSLSRLDVVSVPPGVTVVDHLAELTADGRVRIAEAEIRFRPSRAPTDPLFPYQTHLRQIRCPEAWDSVPEAPTVVAAVVDSGLDTSHPEFAGLLWRNPAEVADGIDNDGEGYVDDINGWDFVDNDATIEPTGDGLDNDGAGGPDENTPHGTEVAGALAAIGGNGIGGVGVAPSARLMVLRIFPADGSASLSDIAEAMSYAVRHGADIINLSLGGGFNHVLDEVIDEAYAHGILVVAAAGNEGHDLDQVPSTPASNDQGENKVLGVAAVTGTDRRAQFSSYGASAIDFCAPGVDVLVPTTGREQGGYALVSGTSLATPIVSGVAALVKAAHPELRGAALRDRLLETADSVASVNPGFEAALGRGRVNAWRAVDGRAGDEPPEVAGPTPAVGAEIPGAEVTLSWTTGGTTPAGVSYDVFMGDAEPPPFRATVDEPTWVASGLVSGHDYRWRVVARATDGRVRVGPLWGFVSGLVDPAEPDNGPAQAASVAPDGALRGRMMEAGGEDWAAFTGTRGVTYEVLTVAPPDAARASADTVLSLHDSAGTRLAENDDIRFASDPSSRITWTCPADGVYLVRVRGFSGASEGRYDLAITEVRRTGAASPAVPSGPSPPDLALDQSASVTLSWGPHAEPDDPTRVYDVFATVDGVERQVADGISVRRATMEGLSDGAACRWWVRARTSGGFSVTGPVWRFAVGTGDPYEPDSAPERAPPILPGGAPLDRAFHSADDTDLAVMAACPGATYSVEALAVPGREPAAPCHLTVRTESGSLVTEGDGSVSFVAAASERLLVRAEPRVGPGFYRLLASGPTAQPAALSVTVGTVEARYGDPIHVSGTVTDELGVGLPGIPVRFALVRPTIPARTWLLGTTTPDPDGRFALETTLAPPFIGECTLQATCDSAPAVNAATQLTVVVERQLAPSGQAGTLGIIASPVASLAGDFLSPEPYRLATYDADSATWGTSAGRDTPLSPGRAAFVRHEGADLTYRASAGDLASPDEPFVAPLAQGWNLIGNPFVGRMVWDLAALRVWRGGAPVGTLAEAARLGLVAPYAWRWDRAAGAYSLVFDLAADPSRDGWLEPFEGAFLLSNAAGLALEIPPPGAAVRSSTPPRAPSSATLHLEVALPDGRAKSLVVLLDPAALDPGPAPPGPRGAEPQARAGFRVGGGIAPVAACSLGRALAIVIRAGETPGRALIRVPDLRGLRRDLRPILRDPRTGWSVDLRSAAGWAADLAPNETRELMLEWASADAPLRVRMVDVLAGSRGLAVRAELTRAARVTVTIRNAAGRTVRSQDLGDREAGELEVRWDGRSDRGSAQPAGLYTVVVRAESSDGQRAGAEMSVSR